MSVAHPLTLSDFSPDFFNDAFARAGRVVDLEVLDCQHVPGTIANGVISELVSQASKKVVGLFPFVLTCRRAGAEPCRLEVIVKSKPTDVEVMNLGRQLSTLCGDAVVAAYEAHGERLGFRRCHVKEISLYLKADPRLDRNRPMLFGAHLDDAREAFVLVLEHLRDMELLNSVEDRAIGWGASELATAIDGLAEIQSVWLGRTECLRDESWLVDTPSAARSEQLGDWFETLLRWERDAFPDLVRADLCELGLRWIHDPRWWWELHDLPKTLVHGDFNPRNLALRRTSAGERRLCAYDWEVATIHVPQRDLIDLLTYTAAPSTPAEEILRSVELHRCRLEKHSGTTIAARDWQRGFELALRDFTLERLPIYLMAQRVIKLPFVEHVANTVQQMVSLFAR